MSAAHPDEPSAKRRRVASLSDAEWLRLATERAKPYARHLLRIFGVQCLADHPCAIAGSGALFLLCGRTSDEDPPEHEPRYASAFLHTRGVFDGIPEDLDLLQPPSPPEALAMRAAVHRAGVAGPSSECCAAMNTKHTRVGGLDLIHVSAAQTWLDVVRSFDFPFVRFYWDVQREEFVFADDLALAAARYGVCPFHPDLPRHRIIKYAKRGMVFHPQLLVHVGEAPSARKEQAWGFDLQWAEDEWRRVMRGVPRDSPLRTATVRQMAFGGEEATGRSGTNCESVEHGWHRFYVDTVEGMIRCAPEDNPREFSPYLEDCHGGDAQYHVHYCAEMGVYVERLFSTAEQQAVLATAARALPDDLVDEVLAPLLGC